MPGGLCSVLEVTPAVVFRVSRQAIDDMDKHPGAYLRFDQAAPEGTRRTLLAKRVSFEFQANQYEACFNLTIRIDEDYEERMLDANTYEFRARQVTLMSLKLDVSSAARVQQQFIWDEMRRLVSLAEDATELLTNLCKGYRAAPGKKDAVLEVKCHVVIVVSTNDMDQANVRERLNRDRELFGLKALLEGEGYWKGRLALYDLKRQQNSSIAPRCRELAEQLAEPGSWGKPETLKAVNAWHSEGPKLRRAAKGHAEAEELLGGLDAAIVARCVECIAQAPAEAMVEEMKPMDIEALLNIHLPDAKSFIGAALKAVKDSDKVLCSGESC